MPGSLSAFITRIVALIVAITVHEFAHSLAATELGDPTSKNQGRLTLNPLAHLDPIGSLMILVARFGWGKPVPVNPYMLRTDPTVGMALVSLAGPASNIVTALVFALPLRLGWLSAGKLVSIVESIVSMFPPPMHGMVEAQGILTWFVGLMVSIIIINLVLAIFNMIPLAPLDGYKVALAVLPYDFANQLRQYETYGPIILMLLIFLPTLIPGVNFLGTIMGPPINFMFSLLTGIPARIF